MPRLEGLSGNTETIRTYYSFYVSRYKMESRKDIRMQEIGRQLMRKGVAEICSKCTQQGYYVVGLERGEIIQESSPAARYENYAEYEKQLSAIPYTLTLGLYVRRFSTSLTGDELYYWSKQATDRILFEMNQLDSRPFSNWALEKITQMFDDDMLRAAGVVESQPVITHEAKEEKPRQYNIIRRPKCPNMNY